MVIKNIVINETNGAFHIIELNTSAKNGNKNELKMSSILSDIINEVLTDEKFIKKAMILKK